MVDNNIITKIIYILVIGMSTYSFLYSITDNNRNYYSCNHGVVVMTPEGYATTVCAP